MGYGALSDEQTSTAMERNKRLKQNLVKTYHIAKWCDQVESSQKKVAVQVSHLHGSPLHGLHWHLWNKCCSGICFRFRCDTKKVSMHRTRNLWKFSMEKLKLFKRLLICFAGTYCTELCKSNRNHTMGQIMEIIQHQKLNESQWYELNADLAG